MLGKVNEELIEKPDISVGVKVVRFGIDRCPHGPARSEIDKNEAFARSKLIETTIVGHRFGGIADAVEGKDDRSGFWQRVRDYESIVARLAIHYDVFVRRDVGRHWTLPENENRDDRREQNHRRCEDDA